MRTRNAITYTRYHTSASCFPRYSSYSPMGQADTKPRKKVTIQTLRNLYRKGEPIAALTAYDYPSGLVADAAGMVVVLVGDSLAMVAMGMEDTNEVTMEEMLVHCRSVSRAVKSAFLIADLPFGSYEVSPEQAVVSSLKMIKEGGARAAGIPVMAHIGLTPQRQHSLGGFRVQAKSVAGAAQLLRDVIAVQDAGAFMILVEAVPAEVAALITKRLCVPTIGIEAGNGCSEQVLVQGDVVGNFPLGRDLPRFVKTYADVWGEMIRGIGQYRCDVKSSEFPSEFTYNQAFPQQNPTEFQRLVERSAEGNDEPYY
ncbi:3-methyl-2-oxobutanoate hydroxymethyltransferase [Aspergillus avenaceus]|uniref:3-methyl-2-oxobutanoate hydroxymethyltransferase n=1 Tax=Aspergillus avenaceus TaxID=36643 RepID=A0A5N6TS12_ASPAV|nr:3-methyl-2-oxobutanoate hydroxymethyltransferase [Aspergillus avenaceus]